MISIIQITITIKMMVMSTSSKLEEILGLSIKLIQVGSILEFHSQQRYGVQANYDHAKSYLNVGSLIDYYLLNVYTVNADWLNWNTAWWKTTRMVTKNGDMHCGTLTTMITVPTIQVYRTDPDADPCDTEGMGDVGGQEYSYMECSLRF